MMLLNERQRTAEALAREINRFGNAWVTTPLPLADSAKGIRFQVLDSAREKVLERLASWDWSLAWCGSVPRITPHGMQPATVYEVDVPHPQPVVVDDRKMIAGEIAERKKTSVEVEAIRKYLGWK